MAIITSTRHGKRVYRVRWAYRDRSIDGKPYNERQFSSKQEAERFHRAVNGTHSPSNNATVADIAERWKAEYTSISLAHSTHLGYSSALRTHIIPSLGRVRIDRLSPEQIHDWQRELTALGVTPVTLNHALRTLRALYVWARSVGITDNQAPHHARAIRARTHPAPPRAYKPDELDAIANAAERLRDRTLFYLAASTGLRKSELFNLRWEHVTLGRDPMVTVVTSKTPAGRRTVPVMLDVGINAINEWAEHGTTGLVFASLAGTPLSRNWARDVLPKVRKASGIHVQMHELRDTYASILIATGAGEAEITMALGHASVETTRRHYAVWLEPRKWQSARAGNALWESMRAEK